MKLYREIYLSNFEPWSGAKSTFNRIENEDKLEQLEAILEEQYPDGMSETELNDLFWFEEDWLFEILDIRSESQIEDELETAKQELEELISDRSYELEDCETEEEKTAVLLEYEDEIYDKENEIESLEEELEEVRGY